MCQKYLSVNETDNEQETESKLREISEEGTYEEFSQISIKTNTAYHKKIYDAIYSFKNDGPYFINTFKDYNQCDDFLTLHFSQLDPTNNNIFKPNNPVEIGLDGLYLNVISLKRLICSFDNGWLNDTIFTQLADLMNFYEEFESQTGTAGKSIPNILFGDGYAEQVHFNPNHLKKSNYGLINGDVPANMNGVDDGEIQFQSELKRWYGTNRHNKLDCHLSAFDANDCVLDHFCAPVNIGYNHWVVLDVIMPRKDLDNGSVMITDHLYRPDEDELRDQLVQWDTRSSYYARMWAAKYFDIYHIDSHGVKPSQPYLGYEDMDVNGFNKNDWDTKKPFSTLDHKKNSNPNRGIQNDNFNCGVWVLMEMFNRESGVNEPIGTRTIEELKQY